MRHTKPINETYIENIVNDILSHVTRNNNPNETYSVECNHVRDEWAFYLYEESDNNSHLIGKLQQHIEFDYYKPEDERRKPCAHFIASAILKYIVHKGLLDDTGIKYCQLYGSYPKEENLEFEELQW